MCSNVFFIKMTQFKQNFILFKKSCDDEKAIKKEMSFVGILPNSINFEFVNFMNFYSCNIQSHDTEIIFC